MSSLVEIGPRAVVLEKKTFKYCQCIFAISYFPLEKGVILHLNKLEFPPPKDSLCPVWLKLAEHFRRRRFFKILSM